MSDKKTFVFDLDGTLCQEKLSDLSYDQYAYVKISNDEVVLNDR